ncbi:MAG: hypothetical protein ABIN48_00425 [Ginsengibacter sp.]
MDKKKNIKYNDSTDLRPDGERILDAPLVHMDLNEYSKTIKSEKAWKEKDRNAITVFKTDAMSMVLIALHKNAVLERHTANGTLNVQVLNGEIDFATDHQKINMKQGQVIALHAGVPHEVSAIKESVLLLTIAMNA